VLPILITVSIVHDGMTHDQVVNDEIEVSVGDRIAMHIPRQEGGATYNLEGLPETAVARAEDQSIAVQWEPRDPDVGTHRVSVEVQDGEEDHRRTIAIVVNERGHQIFVPGVIGAAFVPNNLQDLGAFAGGGVEIVLFSYAEQGSVWVPSHGRFYLDAMALASTHANIDPLFSVSLGFDLTLERSPGRRYLLPYVGVQMGIAYQQQSGSFGWAMPLIGIYPWASHAVRVSLQGGYLLPTTASQDLRGIVVQASVDLAPF
jgi:hypothetical protein